MIHLITDVPDEDSSRIVTRPDGYYWVDPDTGVEFGPFPSVELAIADMKSSAESEFEPGETLEEAQAEIGISDWVDPDTGSLAEDSVPHLDD